MPALECLQEQVKASGLPMLVMFTCTEQLMLYVSAIACSWLFMGLNTFSATYRNAPGFASKNKSLETSCVTHPVNLV